jgi:RNA polymerase sigma factor (sigma-70 family)
MDLVSVGTIGMYEAFENFDFTKNVRFCTYAKFYIQRAINAYINNDMCMVRTTNNSKLLPKVKRIKSTFFAKEGRYPNVDEIINILNTKYNIKNVNPADLNMATMSYLEDAIDCDNTNDDYNMYNSIVFTQKTASYNDYEKESDYDHLIYLLKRELGKLSDRERIIICMSTGYGYDQEYKDADIAQELGLTSERVRQIRIKIQNKLMKALTITR